MIDSDPKGESIYEFAKELFPICRSLTGDGVRLTMEMIRNHLPGLKTYEVPSGETCFDWQVPLEWNVKDAYVQDENGKRVIDFQKTNLHLVSYSEPVDLELSLEELQKHLFSLPDQPDAIPYITSYYRKFWGFCISERDRKNLKEGRYRVKVDSELKQGSLTYADLLIPGQSKDEILISTYVCHPSMANNEVSGPAVTTFLAKWIQSAPRRYSYRIVFVPETLGAIVYLSKNIEQMKLNTRAGFVVNCVGDERAVSFLPSKDGNTLADRVALHVLKNFAPQYDTYTFLDRGSDERQYCAPGIDLPVVSIMRSKYGTYPEYHTSLDDLSVITAKGLGGALALHKKAIEALEGNRSYQTTVLGEPQLGKRGLRPQIGLKNAAQVVRNMSNLIAYSDGKHDLISIADLLKIPVQDLIESANKLVEHGLFRESL